MTISKCSCGNDARYINELGELCCGVCPIAQGLDSIKLSDVPALLKWCREYLGPGNPSVRMSQSPTSDAVAYWQRDFREELRSLIGRKPLVPS